MPAIDFSAIATRDMSHSLVRRANNWPGNNPGVMVVFVIVFVVAVGLLALFISKKLAARKERRERLAAHK
ncbi:hypothetical protein MMC10_009924 [Thelotrema lepadinum]|nr:hypothetical protein [Thelotrema lepadinum]